MAAAQRQVLRARLDTHFESADPGREVGDVLVDFVQTELGDRDAALGRVQELHRSLTDFDPTDTLPVGWFAGELAVALHPTLPVSASGADPWAGRAMVGGAR